MLNIILIFSSISLPFSITSFLLVKYFYAGDNSAIFIIASIALSGFLTHIVLTVIAYVDCNNRSMTPDERVFWKNVLIRCFYYFSGTPIYYWRIMKKKSNKKDCYTWLEAINADMIYSIFRLEIYGSLFFLLLAGMFSLVSLFSIRIIEMPVYFFSLSFYIILPFPIISYVFYLKMLDRFVKNSKDVDELICFFGQKRWLFGVVNYYKSRKGGRTL